MIICCLFIFSLALPVYADDGEEFILYMGSCDDFDFSLAVQSVIAASGFSYGKILGGYSWDELVTVVYKSIDPSEQLIFYSEDLARYYVLLSFIESVQSMLVDILDGDSSQLETWNDFLWNDEDGFIYPLTILASIGESVSDPSSAFFQSGYNSTCEPFDLSSEYVFYYYNSDEPSTEPTVDPDATESTEPADLDDLKEILLEQIDVIKESVYTAITSNLYGAFLVTGTLVGLFLLRGRYGT